jgi:hypothetical protein
MPGKRKQFVRLDRALRNAYQELLPHLRDKTTGKLYVEIIPPDAYFYFHLAWDKEFSEWSKQQAEQAAPKRGLRPYCINFQTPAGLRDFYQQVDVVRNARFWAAFRYDPDYRRDFEKFVAQFPKYKEIEQAFFEGDIEKAQALLAKADPADRKAFKNLSDKWGLRWLPDPARGPMQLVEKKHSREALSARPRGVFIMAFYKGISSEDEKILKKANFVIPVFAETTEDDVIAAYWLGRFMGKQRALRGLPELDRTIWKLSEREKRSYDEIIKLLFPEELNAKIIQIQREGFEDFSYIQERALRALHPLIRDAKRRWETSGHRLDGPPYEVIVADHKMQEIVSLTLFSPPPLSEQL